MKLQYVFSIIIFIFACSPETEQEIRKLDFKELRERINKGEVNLFEVTYKDSIGKKLTKELRTKLNQGKMFRDFYVDIKNEITQIRLKDYSHEHVFEEIQIRELLNQPLKGYQFLNVKCEKADSLLLDAFDKDQNIRNGGEGSFFEIDSINQQIAISIIEKCGWPSEEETVRAIWYIIQHADSKFQVYYYPKFKEFVNNEILSASTMALMDDRILMNNGYPQLYGSQIVQNDVYQLRDSKNVNKFRSEVGLGPIEDYTRNFGFEFSPNDNIEK